MADFQRDGSCNRCGKSYLLRGSSANPGNETQVDVSLPCSCGGTITAMVPGSANRDRLRVETAGG
jgi:hypothetical protein